MTDMPIVREQSISTVGIEHQIHAEGNSAVAQIINGVKQLDFKEWAILLILIASLTANGIFFSKLHDAEARTALEFREKATQEDLKRWDMDQFKSHEFLQVQADVAVTKKLAEAALLNSQLRCKL